MEDLKRDIKEIKLNLQYHIKRTDLLEDYVKSSVTSMRWLIGGAMVWFSILVAVIQFMGK